MSIFFKIFVKPGEVFAGMQPHIPSVPPLVILVLSVSVLTAAQAWFVPDEEYARINEVAQEETTRMMKPFTDAIARTIIRGGQSEEDVDTFLEEYDARLETQFEYLSSPEYVKSLKQVTVVFAPLTTLFMYGVVLLIEATYFLIAGNMMKCTKQWSEWIGFTLWSTLPLALFWLIFTVETMLFGSVFYSSVQAPLSWLPGLESNVFALSLTIPLLLTLWIRTVGMHRWVEKPIANCLLVALFPTLLTWVIRAGNLQLSNPFIG